MFNLDSFISNNYKGVYNFAISKKLSHHDAEDLVQNVLIDFCEKFAAKRINVELKPENYLFKLAQWRILDRQIKLTSNKKLFQTIGEDNNLDEIPSDKREETEKKQILYEAFKIIKGNNRDKNIFKSLIFDGESAKDAAILHKTSTFTVHLAKHRIGKKVIRAAKFLNDYGI